MCLIRIHFAGDIKNSHFFGVFSVNERDLVSAYHQQMDECNAIDAGHPKPICSHQSASTYLVDRLAKIYSVLFNERKVGSGESSIWPVSVTTSFIDLKFRRNNIATGSGQELAGRMVEFFNRDWGDYTDYGNLLPLEALRLWLRADSGVENAAPYGRSISVETTRFWGAAANQPTLVTNAITVARRALQWRR